jgi:hypothetical protein
MTIRRRDSLLQAHPPTPHANRTLKTKNFKYAKK